MIVLIECGDKYVYVYGAKIGGIDRKDSLILRLKSVSLFSILNTVLSCKYILVLIVSIYREHGIFYRSEIFKTEAF